MDRGAWWATVHVVTKSRKQLKQLSTKKAMQRIRTLSGKHLNASSTLNIQCTLERHSSKAVNNTNSKTECELLNLPLDDLDELEQVNYTH